MAVLKYKDPTTGTVTLSETAANFTYLEFFLEMIFTNFQVINFLILMVSQYL